MRSHDVLADVEGVGWNARVQEVTKEALFDAILRARERVYAVGSATPLEKVELAGFGASVWLKREDLGPIKAFKWRGAFNKMASLSEAERARGVVAASAGNHAQGVAIGAKRLSCSAVIFMPVSTPEVKQREVRRHGGDNVEIRLIGDTYDEAAEAAKKWAEESGAVFVHPYDDIDVIGGQGTLADEVVMSGEGPFDRVYVAIGGGGLAAGVACWLKHFWPEVKVIGVEGVDQASMAAAFGAGKPVEIGYVDVFCDGTAVRKVGSNTYPLCHELLDEIVTVTNAEVCHAVRATWEAVRAIPEPSGAMALAGYMKDLEQGRVNPGEKVLSIVCGANMDFAQLAMISRRAGIGSKHRRFLRVPIPEGRGTLLDFLRGLPAGVNIIDLQYGRTDSDVQYPVLGLIGSEEDYKAIDQLMVERQAELSDVSKDEDVDFRIIHYDADTFTHPIFVHLEFPERPGAFLRFMQEVRDIASLCYFNYTYTGERVGRALVGIDFADEASLEEGRKRIIAMSGTVIRAAREVSKDTFARITGRSE